MSRRPHAHKTRSARRVPPPASNRARFLEPIAWALILLATFLVYLPARHGAPLWDDDVHITRPELQSPHGLYRIWFEFGATQQYYPIVHTAFWIEHKLWGDNVLGYHLVNVLWHLISVVLLYRILKTLSIPGALLAAAVFALHPVMVESVAWISEQKNTLSAVFYLSAALVYLKFDQSRAHVQYFFALALFVLALLSKTTSVTLPAALLVIFWWQRRNLSWTRDLLPLLPFFALAALSGVVTCWVEWNFVGTKGANFEFTVLERLLLAGRAVWFYLGQLAWPRNLMLIYPRWRLDPTVWWQWLFPIAVLATTIALAVLRTRRRAPLAAWLLFCGTLLPMLGFLNQYLFLYTFVSDHFQYLASLGMIVLASAAIALVLTRLGPAARRVGVTLCVLCVAALATLSWRHSALFGNPAALYQATIDGNPDCWVAHYNLALELAASGQQQAAIDHYRLAIRLKPDYVEAYNNLSREFMRTGNFEEAIKNLQQAVQAKPDSAEASSNLGAALLNAGRVPEAIDCLQHALRLDPDYADAHNNLGVAFLRTGRNSQAIEQFKLTLTSNPLDAGVHINLANALAQAGERNEAISQFQEASELAPDLPDVHLKLANLLQQSGEVQPAIEHYQAALRANAHIVEAYPNLARALALADRSQDAIAVAEKGIGVARSMGQEAAAEQIEDWLSHFRTELRRNSEAVSPRSGSE